MPKIFIPYRRKDGKDMVGRIADWLKLTHGDIKVFTDVYNITRGTDFRQTFDAAIRLCDLVIAAIGPRWAAPESGSTDPRILQDGDWVCAELEIATRNGILIIPVLIDGASMPSASQLPYSLAQLRFLQAATVRPDPDFRTDIVRLRDANLATAYPVRFSLQVDLSRHHPRLDPPLPPNLSNRQQRQINVGRVAYSRFPVRCWVSVPSSGGRGVTDTVSRTKSWYRRDHWWRSSDGNRQLDGAQDATLHCEARAWSGVRHQWREVVRREWSRNVSRKRLCSQCR